MSTRSPGLSDALYRYLLDYSLREPEALRRLREETAAHPEADMQIAPEQGQFMALLCRMLGARRTLEIGVFTGYSAAVVALALPEGGEVVALDRSETYTRTAQRYWQEAGVADRIRLILGDASESLEELLRAGEENTFDFAFIDADKERYERYYEASLALVRPGGVIAIDNVFRSGRVADPRDADPGVEAVRALNRRLHRDERIDLSVLPIADGLTLARKR